MSMSSERTPLLWSQPQTQAVTQDTHNDDSATDPQSVGKDVHTQFCGLIGCPPSNAPTGYKFHLNKKSLYGRVTGQFTSQNRTYLFSASLSNTLLLSQVIIGAALTGLGGSAAPYWLITMFGALNTIIAGLVAYLKSRGQPMRARMYRDDLERIVDEIENSEIMWLGIATKVHGYDDIDTDGEVTVRSEVARLTRLYERAVRNNSMNNPDMYMAGQDGGPSKSGLKDRSGQPVPPAVPAIIPDGAAPAANAPIPAAPAPVAMDPDQSPASAPSKPKDEKKDEPAKDDSKKEQDTKPESSTDATKDISDTDKGKTAAPTDNAESTPATTPAPSAPTPAPAATAAPAVTTTPAPAPTVAPAATPIDDDASPASRAHFTNRSKSEDKLKKADAEEKPKKVEGDEE